jgi:hypothetical protein
MLYFAIDQHRKQLTVSLRDEQGDVLIARRVSTRWERVRAFLAELREGRSWPAASWQLSRSAVSKPWHATCAAFAGGYSRRASSSSVWLLKGKGWPTRLRTIVREFCAVRICVWKPAETL